MGIDVVMRIATPVPVELIEAFNERFPVELTGEDENGPWRMPGIEHDGEISTGLRHWRPGNGAWPQAREYVVWLRERGQEVRYGDDMHHCAQGNFPEDWPPILTDADIAALDELWNEEGWY